MVPLGDEPGLRLAFTVPTQIAWGVAVRRGDDQLRVALDGALETVIADGRLRPPGRAGCRGSSFR